MDLFVFMNLFKIRTRFVQNGFNEFMNHFVTKGSCLWSFLWSVFFVVFLHKRPKCVNQFGTLKPHEPI